MHLRFTIRDLLWLTLVVALAVGWWVDHRSVVERLPIVEAYRAKTTYPITPRVVLNSLQSEFYGKPGLRISLDANTNDVIVQATRADQMKIRAFIKRFEEDSQELQQPAQK